jgi:hypothetical protein
MDAGTGTELCRCGMRRVWRFLHIQSALLELQDQSQAAGTTASVQIVANIFDPSRVIVNLAVGYARMAHPRFRACRGRNDPSYRLKCGKAVWWIRLV